MLPPSTPQHGCAQCGTRRTPMWRSGPSGPKTLCNACGQRWKTHGYLKALGPKSQTSRRVERRTRSTTSTTKPNDPPKQNVPETPVTPIPLTGSLPSPCPLPEQKEDRKEVEKLQDREVVAESSTSIPLEGHKSVAIQTQPLSGTLSSSDSLWRHMEEGWARDVSVQDEQEEDRAWMEMVALEERIRLLRQRWATLRQVRDRRRAERWIRRSSWISPFLSPTSSTSTGFYYEPDEQQQQQQQQQEEEEE